MAEANSLATGDSVSNILEYITLDEKTADVPDWRSYLEVVEIKGNGRGYRALVDIPAQTCIMHDKLLMSPPFPADVILQDSHQYPRAITTPIVKQLLEEREFFDILSPQQPSGKFFNEKSPCPSEYNDTEWELAFEKVLTNVFVGELSRSHPYIRPMKIFKLCARTSLFNHSCFANAIVRSVSGAVMQQVETIRDIKKGEEVCISYRADGYLPKEERQKILLARGFECRCERCSANPPRQQDIILISNIDGKPVSNETITILRSNYDRLQEELREMFGRSTPDLVKTWIKRAEDWLAEAHRPPYRLHDYHWLCKHMHSSLRD